MIRPRPGYPYPKKEKTLVNQSKFHVWLGIMAIPLPKELRGNGKTGDVAHVSFPNKDWGRANGQQFAGLPSRK